MEMKITEVGPCVKEVEVLVPEERIRAAVDRSFLELRNQVAMPGFRQGKIPRSVLEKRFGDQVRHDVLHTLMEEVSGEVVSELKIDAVSEPRIKDQEEGSPHHHLPMIGPMTLTFVVEYKADFELPAYRGVEVDRRLLPSREIDVDRVLARIAGANGTWMPIEDEIWQPGCMIGGDATLTMNGEATLDNEPVTFESDEPIIKDEFKVLNVEKTFAGKKVGDTVEVTALLTEDEDAEDGVEDVIGGSIVITELKRREAATLDDAFAVTHGHASLAEMRDTVRKDLDEQRRSIADHDVVQRILDKILESVQIPIAPGPVDRMLRRRNLQLALRQGSVDPKDQAALLQAATADNPELRKSIERDTRCWLLVEKIAKKERIFCLEDDVDREIARMAAQYDQTPSKMREMIEHEKMLPGIRAEILERKTCEFLRTSARITDVEVKESAAEGAAAG